MTPEEFRKKLEKNAKGIEKLVSRTLPVKAGAMAQKHFRENFRKGGFVDDALKPWKPSKRIGKAKGAAGRYGTLLSERKMLYNSIKRKTVPGAAIIYTSDQTQDYAAVHNEGGTIRVTQDMKGWFWRRYYELLDNLERKKDGTLRNNNKNRQLSAEAEFYKAMALKKVGSTIKIPKRQFIGDSRRLDKDIMQLIEDEAKAFLGD